MNYAVLMLGLITSQFVNDSTFEINKMKQILFFKAQLDHGRDVDALLDGTSNSFQPLEFQADQSNDTLHYGQAVQAKGSEDFKLTMKRKSTICVKLTFMT